MDPGVTRYAATVQIRTDRLSHYRASHATLPGDLVRACRQAGMRNYTGFLGGPDGCLAVLYFETDDLAATLARLDADPASATWRSQLGEVFATKMTPMAQLFHIA